MFQEVFERVHPRRELGAGCCGAEPVTAFEILTGFSSKEACSCAFVAGQTDAYCTEFGKIGGYNVKDAIDRSKKVVTSSFAGTSRSARVVEGGGCTLDPLAGE